MRAKARSPSAGKTLQERRTQREPWTPERDEQLRDMWERQALADGEIARRLGGTTRAAVRWRAWTLGLDMVEPRRKWARGARHPTA